MVTAERPFRDSGSSDVCERSAFLIGLAHDLRQTLTVISVTTQMTGRRIRGAANPPPASVLAALEIVHEAAARLAAQVAELDDFAVLEGDCALPLDRRAVDLVAMAHDTVARHARTSDSHRLPVLVEEPAGASIVGDWDSRKLERVLDNLVGNALKFSPAGGDVTIEVGREPAPTSESGRPETAVLRVRDQGIGIPASDLPHVFDYLRRAGNIANTIPGTGVGLAVVRQIIERHGGTVQAASSPGSGATFTLRLPLSFAEPATA